MEHKAAADISLDWKKFVLAYGWRVQLHYLEAVVQQSRQAIQRVRAVGPLTRRPIAIRFEELFSLWHGHVPSEADWPAPQRGPKTGNYEWQTPEVALLATLVGQLSYEEIAQTLTERLRRVTGDPTALRNKNSVTLAANRIGLQSSDVVGGITPAQAGREIGSITIVRQAIANGTLKASRLGPRLVISYDDWEAWKARRVGPPDGYVRLTTLKGPLGIRSDKLSEWARMGYIPTALRCMSSGARGPSTQYGTWYVDASIVEQLVNDRRAGRPMPWHGKPLADNMRVTFKLWESRRHPADCETCVQIWGPDGTPTTFENYALRYPPLAHGAKRHLTRQWAPGLTLDEVAVACATNRSRVERAIKAGLLAARKRGRHTYVTKTDASRWKARKCPVGDRQSSWISLATAVKMYAFALEELEALIASGTLNTKARDAGASRGIVYVPRQQCVDYRHRHGYGEAAAAAKVGVSLEEFRTLLAGVNWRGATGIPLVTIQAVQKRLESKAGHSLEEAAQILGTTPEWVGSQRDNGTIRVQKAKWDEERVYITGPMLERLRGALGASVGEEELGHDWLRLSDAADVAGVSIGTIRNWADAGKLERRDSRIGARYHRDAVRSQARDYWKTVRSHRATPPNWLFEEWLRDESLGACRSRGEAGTSAGMAFLQVETGLEVSGGKGDWE